MQRRLCRVALRSEKDLGAAWLNRANVRLGRMFPVFRTVPDLTACPIGCDIGQARLRSMSAKHG